MDGSPRDNHAELGPINSEDEARRWVLELVEQCEATRRLIDVAGGVREQRKLFCRWMILRGQAHGVISALMRCQRISDLCHNQLRERVLATEHPTVVPAVMDFGPRIKL